MHVMLQGKYPQAVHFTGFQPEQMPYLIEHNNTLVVELLLQLSRAQSLWFLAFLDTLTKMQETSVRPCMEVTLILLLVTPC
jgi:hypothetical protein